MRKYFFSSKSEIGDHNLYHVNVQVTPFPLRQAQRKEKFLRRQVSAVRLRL